MGEADEFPAAKREENEFLERLKKEGSVYYGVFRQAFANLEKLIKGKRVSRAVTIKAKCLECTCLFLEKSVILN